MRVRVLTNNSARFIGGCQTSTGTCTTRGYKFGPEVWMVFRTPDQRTLADSPIIPSGQLNNRLSEYVHIMGRSRMQLFSGVHDIEDIPPDADIRGYV